MKKILVLTVLFFGLTGCVSLPYSHTSDNTFASKSKNCKFRIKGSVPSPYEYEEIGTINGCSGTNNISDYQKKIQENVCKAGGDLVVGDVNGYGVYCRGTVFVKIKNK